MSADRRRLLVVAVGGACWAVASAANKSMAVQSGEGGWFNYAPNNGVAFSSSSGWIFRELLIWLIAIAIWLVISLRLLHQPDED